jgi:hypothetical protein
VTDEQYAAAMRQREDFNGRFNALLETVDAVVCPSGGHPFSVAGVDMRGDTEALGPLFAPGADALHDPRQLRRHAHADAALRLLRRRTGLPYTPCSSWAGACRSRCSLRIGHAYESATAWHERHPPV